MKIEHRAGRLYANADGPSRRPWPANHVADMLEETENSPAQVIVGNTTRSNTTTSAEGAQSECCGPMIILKESNPKTST